MAVTDFRIVPKGIHPLFLGMDRDQVDNVMKESPKAARSRVAGEEILYFTNARVTMRDHHVVEIGLTPLAQVYWQGKLLFDDPTAWRELVATDANPQESLGFIILPEQCLTLTGFHDNDTAQLAITAFEPGRWDLLSQEMKPFRHNDS